MALNFKLFPEKEEQSIADSLAKDVTEKYDYHFSTGIFGLRYLYWALSNYGYEKEAVQLINQTTAPSLGHIFSAGATTIWERIPISETAINPEDASWNHPMQGGFTAWFYQGIGGIVPDPQNPGFKHFFLRPQLTENLEFTDVEFKSIHGLISSKWKNRNGKFQWEIKVPVNSSATIYFPAADISEISESGKSVSDNSDIEFIKREGKHCIFNIPSGEFDFIRR